MGQTQKQKEKNKKKQSRQRHKCASLNYFNLRFFSCCGYCCSDPLHGFPTHWRGVTFPFPFCFLSPSLLTSSCRKNGEPKKLRWEEHHRPNSVTSPPQKQKIQRLLNLFFFHCRREAADLLRIARLQNSSDAYI